MRFGKVTCIAVSGNKGGIVYKSGEGFKESEVNGFTSLVKTKHIVEIDEAEYQELYKKKYNKQPLIEKTEPEPEEIALEELKNSEEYKELIKLNKGSLQEKLEEVGFVGEIEDEWTKHELVVKIINISK